MLAYNADGADGADERLASFQMNWCDGRPIEHSGILQKHRPTFLALVEPMRSGVCADLLADRTLAANLNEMDCL
jgi:hypothetical protein